MNFQKLLGDIHNCDISQDILTGYLKNFSQEENENTNAIGLNTLIQRKGIKNFWNGGQILKKKILEATC